MSKGERTREMIAARAAPLFNTRGYAGVSVSDVMEATGLEKGGIYRHFNSKDELALAAFDHNYGVVQQKVVEVLRAHRGAIPRLRAWIDLYHELASDSFLRGGCPILNTAIEADDAYPALRDRARRAMDEWHTSIIRIVQSGIERQEVRDNVDPAEVATIVTATVEGALMLTKLFNDDVHMKRAIAHLHQYIETTLSKPEGP